MAPPPAVGTAVLSPTSWVLTGNPAGTAPLTANTATLTLVEGDLPDGGAAGSVTVTVMATPPNDLDGTVGKQVPGTIVIP
jgi:hypothetical protein